MGRPIKFLINGTMRKWDVVRMAGTRDEGIVINNPIQISGCCTMTLYPYKRKKTKVGRWIWFKWLQLRLWLKIIKIE